ncbi:MAG: hypothetical protein FI707_12745 [SAR202 cluster bacterium]|nr:hypothetical protein [SAR202 cluster bacterium]HAL49121.1 hypothetical protein [Dehalococcoidia bacterium]|tara:strand:+ start:2250 stop:3437 length:1188 start_codon:yes stop_codon:yes gene_type:complete
MATLAASWRSARPNYIFLAWIAVLGLVALVGLYSFVRQTVDGHHITGLSDTTPWGLYMAGFVFFVGASAGAMIIGLMIHAFGREDYAPLGTRAILVGLACLTSAMAFITVHVGSIPKMMLIPWLWRNPTSMFMYTSITYYIFTLILLGELYFTVKVTRGTAGDRDKTMAKWMALSAVPFALVILHAPHGGLFAVVAAREFWNSSLLPPHFALAALVTGTALMLLVALVTSAISGRRIVSDATLASLGVLLAFFIAITGFADIFDFLVYTYGGKSAGNEAWHFLSGSHLPISVLHVGGYVLAFAVLLFKWGRTAPWLFVASIVTLIGVAAYRYNLTTVGQAVPLFPFLEDVHYTPSWHEISLSLGIVASAILGYSIATKLLPIEAPIGEARTSESP